MAITGPEKQLNLGNSDISVSTSPIIPAYLLIYTHYIFIITDVSVNWLLHPHYIHNILPVFISILILHCFLLKGKGQRKIREWESNVMGSG